MLRECEVERALLPRLRYGSVAELRAVFEENSDVRDAGWRFLSWHHLANYVFSLLGAETVSECASPQEFDRLAQYMRQQRIWQLMLTRRLAEVGGALQKERIEFLVLKGLAFGERYYGDPDRRHVHDLDLMVHREEVDRALEVLRSLGLSSKHKRVRFRSLQQFVRSEHALARFGDGVGVDLHWMFRNRPAYRIDYRRIWETRQSVRIGGKRYDTISDEYALVLMVLSIAHDIARGELKLKHLLDLYLIVHHHGGAPSWEDLLEKRRSENILPLAVNVLSMLFRSFDCLDEYKELAVALEPHRRLVTASGSEATWRLLTAPRGNVENLLWFCRVYPTASQGEIRAWLERNLPHPGRLPQLLGRTVRLSARLVQYGWRRGRRG